MKVISSIFHRLVIRNENFSISDTGFLSFKVNVYLDIKRKREGARARERERQNIADNILREVYTLLQ